MNVFNEIKLTLRENDKVLEIVTKATNTQPSELLKSLQEFQHSVNAALTKMIENSGDTGEILDISESDESEEEESNVPVTPKKIKK